MASGVYRKNVHYFCPEGSDKNGKGWACDPLFKWSAVVDWVEGEKNNYTVSGMVFPVPKNKG